MKMFIECLLENDFFSAVVGNNRTNQDDRYTIYHN